MNGPPPGSPSPAEAERRIRHDGFTLLPGVIPAAEVAAVRDSVVEAQGRRRAESEAMLASIRAKGHRVSVTGVDSLRGVINETQLFAPYLTDERLFGICRAFFGGHVRITTTDCVINRPGCGRGYWHADWPYNQTNASHIPAPYPDALLHLSTIWMLTDFTAENGGTLLVPGSHRFGTNPTAGTLTGVDPDAPYPTETHAVGTAGSVLAYDSRLWHAVPPKPLRRRPRGPGRALRPVVAQPRAGAGRVSGAHGHGGGDQRQELRLPRDPARGLGPTARDGEAPLPALGGRRLTLAPALAPSYPVQRSAPPSQGCRQP